MPKQPFWKMPFRAPFFSLLLALVGYILLAPALPTDLHLAGERAILVGIIFIGAIYVSHASARWWIAVSFFVCLIAAGSLEGWMKETVALDAGLLAVLFGIMVYTCLCILRFAMRSGRVGPEHIYAAICAYVLISMAFATLYLFIQLLLPGSFSGVHAAGRGTGAWWDFCYFSMTTLSTVGFGDIVPVTPRARSLVMTEQLVATFYVATLISRLTGLYQVRDEEEEKEEEREEAEKKKR